MYRSTAFGMAPLVAINQQLTARVMGLEFRFARRPPRASPSGFLRLGFGRGVYERCAQFADIVGILNVGYSGQQRTGPRCRAKALKTAIKFLADGFTIVRRSRSPRIGVGLEFECATSTPHRQT